MRSLLVPEVYRFWKFLPAPGIIILDLTCIAIITLLLVTIDALRAGAARPDWGPLVFMTGFQVASIVTVTHGLVWLALNSATRANPGGTNLLGQTLVNALVHLSSARFFPLLVVGNVVLISIMTFFGIWLLELTFPGQTATGDVGFGGLRLAVVVVANYILLFVIFRPLIRLRAAALELGKEGSTLQSVRPIASDPGVDRLVAAITRELSQVGEYKRRVRELSSQTSMHMEAERKKIARELHDNIGQNLAALLVLEGLLSRTSTGDEKDKLLSKVQDLTRVTLEEVHRLSLGLRPAILDQVGLSGTLEWYVNEVMSGSIPQIKLDLDEELDRFDSEQELALYRIAQEALGNAVRHSSASCITVRLSKEDHWVVLTVADDGVGFDPEDLPVESQKHLGLFSMEERAQLAEGELEIVSGPGKGTTVVARVPAVSYSDSAVVEEVAALSGHRS